MTWKWMLTSFVVVFFFQLQPGCSWSLGRPGRVNGLNTHQDYTLNMVASDVKVRDQGSSSSPRKYSDVWELELRRSIHKKKWEAAEAILADLPPDKFALPSGRNIVYVVTETCRVGRAYESIVPLLSLDWKESYYN
jgi:hypothetical protein